MKKKLPISDINISSEKISYLITIIKNNGSLLTTKNAIAGFDGFIDSLVKIIKDKQEHKPPAFFNTIKEFGNYIIKKEGTSFSLELQELSIKLGGNMPIMANALGQLGVHVICVGALGYPQTHPAFKNLSSNCHIHSFADPGTSTAFEFNDGKIFLAQMGALNTFKWDKIKNMIGIDTLINYYKKSDLLCIVNWSEIDASTDIWKGLLKDVLPIYAKAGEKQLAFFDLSDCSKRNRESITDALMLLKEFGRYTKVILSLNKNEALRIYQVLYNNHIEEDLKSLGKNIFDKINIETLLLHYSKEAIAYNKEGIFACDSFFISNPKISTGAGDNFNAAFAAAQLLRLDLESSLIFANAASGLYVQTGISPQLTDLINFLEVNGKLTS